MSVIHVACNAEVKSDFGRAVDEGQTPGDWGYCMKCGKRVDHLIMVNGQVAISDEVLIQ